jgi:hypothetical protein
MASHKFQVGEIVNLRPIVSRNVPGGAYEVTKQLPYMGASSNIASRVPAKSTSASPEKAISPDHCGGPLALAGQEERAGQARCP